jgi:hypothetical protein
MEAAYRVRGVVLRRCAVGALAGAWYAVSVRLYYRPRGMPMTAADLFPSELTDQEREVGFAVKKIENPDGHYAGYPPMIDAVVYTLSPSRRIVKRLLPEGRVGYQLQRHGRYSFNPPGTVSSWLPDLDFSVPDLAFVVQYFQTPEAEARGQAQKIIERKPVAQ